MSLSRNERGVAAFVGAAPSTARAALLLVPLTAAAAACGSTSIREARTDPAEAAPGLAHAGAPGQFELDGAQLASADEWYLRTDDGCRLYVREFGVGDTVVVLHGGWGAEHSYLLTPFRGLEDDYHLVFYDQRGSLRSPCADSLISVDAHVADLERLRRELGQERLTLAGHSMGTWLAMKYLETHPERTGGLVLLNALVPRIDAGIAERWQAAQEAFSEWAQDTARTAAVLRAEGLDGTPDDLTDRERTHRWRVQFAAANIYHADRWRQLEGGQVFYSQAAGSAAGRTMGGDVGWDFLDDLAAHPYPVSVVIGDHDLVDFGGELHRKQLTPLENATLVMLEHAGHNSWIDRPAAYREALAAGLARATTGGSALRH